jgi:osmotically-inducible protein OsmY
MALISILGIAGCGNTSTLEEPAKSVAPPAPIAASPTKSQKAEPQRVDPASAADRAQAAAVSAAFAADSRLKSFAIDVRAANGTVELFGTVDSESSREKAEKIAARVAGVKSVKNHLVLVSGS